MIVDTSAVVALLLDEAEADAVQDVLLGQAHVSMSAPTHVELGIVVDSRHDAALSRELDELLRGLVVEIVPFDVGLASVARQAYRDFGRGSGHPARLSVGDCFSYALASVRREPLLFVGDGFRHTDVRPAL